MAIIYGTSLSDVLSGTIGNDVIYGYPASGYGSGINDYDGYDALYGYAGDDALYGGNQDDNLYGGSGNDTLNGGTGNNTLYGGTGNDLYIFNSDNNLTIVEYDGEGLDTVQSSSSFDLGPASLENLTLTGTSAINGTGNGLNNKIEGNSGNNVIYGLAGNDSLYGEGGDDILYGGAGNDLLDGYSTSGIEYDTLISGDGSDTFILGGFWGVSYQGLGYATITDWNPASDYIKTIGNSSQYSLGYADYSGDFVLDTQIYYGNDIIANVQDTTNVSISRDFIFA